MRILCISAEIQAQERTPALATKQTCTLGLRLFQYHQVSAMVNAMTNKAPAITIPASHVCA